VDHELPSKVLWGVATSSFQIEGGVLNDMTAWEKCAPAEGSTAIPACGVAVDHWNRWESDFALLKELGVGSYRFSLEWSRLEPQPNRFDTAAFDQYSRMIDKLLDLKIVPMVTLHHFTNPVWLHSVTPWHQPDSISSFLRYVETVSSRLLDTVPLVVTFNEPLVWVLAAYGDGKFPPGFRDLEMMMNALRNILIAHRQAYDLIKEKHPKTQIGIAHNFMVFKRARGFSFADRRLRRIIHCFYNLMIPDSFETNRLKFHFPLLMSHDTEVPLDNKIDFWGVNYYCRMHVRFKLRLGRPFELQYIPRSGEGESDLGWEIYPKGLKRVCRWLRHTGKPVFITENGIAAEDDSRRVQFLKLHLLMLDKAIDEGYPVRGYYHWSLMDNYEWLVGTHARFGLYHVDYTDELRRTIKPSGLFYKEHIARRSNPGSQQTPA
jgi:beta-glucosidase